MAHVQIKAGSGIPGSGQVIVDGVDMTDDILAEGFAINCPRHVDGVWSVTMTVIATSLDAEFDNADVEVESILPPRRLCETEAS